MIPLALIAAAFKVLAILYDHESFIIKPPDVKKNIDFIKGLAEFITHSKYILDQFTVDAVYWQSPANSIKLVSALLIAAPVSFLVLHLFSFRFLICLALWTLVLSQSFFVCDLVQICAKYVVKYDVAPLEHYCYKKAERVFLFFVETYQAILKFY